MVSHRSDVWGAQRRLFGLLPGLAERGVAFTLAAPPDTRLTEEWLERGLRYLPLVLPSHRGLRLDDGRRPSPVALAREAAVVAESTRRIRAVVRDADVVLSYSLNAHVEVVAAARLARRPVVVEVVDLVRPGLGRRLLRGASRLASATVVNSSATAAMLGRPGRPGVHLIHPGVDLERFSPGPPPAGLREELSGAPDRPLVGIVGRLDPEKGVHVLVRAMVLLGDQGVDARLVVVGEASRASERYAATVRRDASAALGDRVRFVGRRDDVPAVLRALDVLVNASRAEPFGLSVLEAQASGVPVIGTDAGGIPEFVADGDTGLLVPPDDPVALAGALRRLVSDPWLRHRLGAGGRRHAVDHHAVADQYDRRAAVYHAAAASGRNRGPGRNGDSARSNDAPAAG